MPKNQCITCPHCGREYLFEELFMPEDVFGKPSVTKGPDGKILSVSGDEAGMVESYVCDGCGKEFVVTAYMRFKVSEPLVDFDEDF